MAGVLNYGIALRTAVAVSDAARAGAQYGSMTPDNAADIAGMQAAARNAAPTLTDMTVSAAPACKCANGSAVSCSASCTTGSMLTYVQVTTSATAPNWFSYTGLSYTGAVSSTATMRAQ
jgi:hypothetical protein